MGTPLFFPGLNFADLTAFATSSSQPPPRLFTIFVLSTPPFSFIYAKTYTFPVIPGFLCQ